MNKKDVILANLKVHTEKDVQENACVVIRGESIHAVVTKDEIKHFKDAEVIDFPEHYSLVPGFIDMHIHGANNSDVMDATVEALTNISQSLAKEGTTGFLATTMTASQKDIEKTLTTVRDFMKQQNANSGARVLGVHLEGPFLSPKKVGAQRSDLILEPKKEYIEHWQKISDHVIKLITIAPELPNSLEFIKYLKQKNIIASIGHTDATYVESKAAIDAGCTHATHLFNAMRGIHQREPGTVTAILLSDLVIAELILDDIHLDPAIVQLVLKLKSKDKIVLVTDSMRAKCLQDGVYDLGGQSVTVKNNVASLSDGTLAGSVLKMNSALQNFIKFTGCSLTDAIQCASENPARALRIYDKKGSIAPNKDADLVILDEKLNVVMTVREGFVIFQK